MNNLIWLGDDFVIQKHAVVTLKFNRNNQTTTICDTHDKEHVIAGIGHKQFKNFIATLSEKKEEKSTTLSVNELKDDSTKTVEVKKKRKSTNGKTK